jgi:elongation factor P
MDVANNISKDTAFNYNNDLYVVVETPTHVQPGKGGAYIKFIASNFRTGERREFKFRSSEKVDTRVIEHRSHELLYTDANKAYFTDDFEIDMHWIDDELKPFLQDGMKLKFYFCDDELKRVILPHELEGTIIENSKGTIKLKGGRRVTGPIHLQVGEKIIFNHETNSFVRRVNGYGT